MTPTCKGKFKLLLERAKRRLGSAPNMHGAMTNEPPLFESYTTTYELFRAECGFSPVEQEVVFLMISAANGWRHPRHQRQDLERLHKSRLPYDSRRRIRLARLEGGATA